MMARKIKVNALDMASVKKALKEVEDYRKDFKRRCGVFIDRLSDIGLEVIHSTMDSVPDEEKGNYHTEIINTGDGNRTGAKIRLKGDKVLFIEFSAGITYGTKDYPLPSGDKYGMGTYPGKGHWDDPNGWYYYDEDGNVRHSYGNRAYMPMYHADEEIRSKISEIAREVFG